MTNLKTARVSLIFAKSDASYFWELKLIEQTRLSIEPTVSHDLLSANLSIDTIQTKETYLPIPPETSNGLL